MAMVEEVAFSKDFFGFCDDSVEHMWRVAEYSKVLAKRCDLPEETVELIYSAAPLHDIGKLGVSNVVLNKKGKLTQEEFEVVKEHCQIGFDMLRGIQQPIMQMAAKIALEHHERFDGSGYPRGLKGNQISLFSRIVAIADVFDALGTERVYKRAWKKDEVVRFMLEERGKGFDGWLVERFLSE